MWFAIRQQQANQTRCFFILVISILEMEEATKRHFPKTARRNNTLLVCSLRENAHDLEVQSHINSIRKKWKTSLHLKKKIPSFMDATNYYVFFSFLLCPDCVVKRPWICHMCPFHCLGNKGVGNEPHSSGNTWLVRCSAWKCVWKKNRKPRVKQTFSPRELFAVLLTSHSLACLDFPAQIDLS